MTDRAYVCRICSTISSGTPDPTLSPSVVLGYCTSCKKRTPSTDLGEIPLATAQAAQKHALSTGRAFDESLDAVRALLDDAKAADQAATDIRALAERVFADDLAPADAGGDDHVQAAYLEWRRTQDGMAVVEAIRRRAVELRRRGWRRYGIQALAEVVRFDRALSVGPDAAGYRVNNSHLSRLARDLMAEDPDLGGFFEVRELRSEVGS